LVYVKGEEVEVNIPEEFNLSEILLDENIRLGRGNKVALYYDGAPLKRHAEEITYEQLLSRACRAGNVLRGLDVEVEDRVAMILYDSPEFVEVFLGAIRMGAQPVPFSTIQTPETYEYMLNDSRAKVLVVHNSLIGFLDSVKDKLRYLKHVVVVGEAEGDKLNYDELMRNASTELAPELLSKDDFCFWLYSSGTTGPPKGVVHLSHDPIYITDTYYKHVLNINEHDVCFSTSKLFFAYGLGNALYAPLRFGASTVLYPGAPEPDKVFNMIQRYHVTVFFSVPVAYSRLLAAKDVASRYDLRSLRVCVSAGEALPAAIYEEWKRRFNVDILDGIGTTEATHIFISNRIGKIKAGSSGIPVPCFEVKILDEDGNDVPAGKVGRLFVKGDSIAALYWRKHDKTKKSFVGEWFDTGDSYYMDDDGFFWHVGRTDDLIKSGGIWVSPVEVEGALLKHQAVLECAVIQSYTDEGVGRPKAYVVLKEGYTRSEKLEAELKDTARSHLKASYKVPTWIEFVAELPKTATGKIQRFKLRDLEKRKLLEVRKELRPQE